MDWIARWFRKTDNRPQVALALSQERVLLASLQPTPIFAQEPCNGMTDWPRAIQALLSRTQRLGSSVRVLVASNLFQQVQIDRPEVPDEELPGALPWAVKDFVNEPVMQLTFDYYELPVNPAARPRLAVVCMQKTRVQQIVNAVNAVASLQSISTEDLGLVELLGVQEPMQLLLYQDVGQDINLLAVCRGQLCFSRQLRGFIQLTQLSLANLSPLLLDNLSLEIQRSLDYLVAQLKLPETRQLHVAIAAPDLGGLIRHLSSSFAIPVSAVANPALMAGLEYLPAYGLLLAKEAE